MPQDFSRRAVLAQITGAGALATVGMPLRHAFAAYDQRPWYFLTDAEAQWLAGVVDVFIPQDDYPSASQAGVVDYIDFQMATGYGQGEGLYLQAPFVEGTPEQGYQLQQPPAEMLRRAIAALIAEGADVAVMDEDARNRFVTDLSERDDDLDGIPSGAFFNELLSLANEGYFADPIYMGNYDYAGWKMVGFPGAHAYYLDRVDSFGRTYDKPPMGIAHGATAPNAPPRLVRGDG